MTPHATAAPRHVPVLARAAVRLGGFPTKFGALLIAVAVTILNVTVPGFEPRLWFAFTGSTRTAPGTVTRVVKTAHFHRMRTASEKTYYEVEYAFDVDGTSYEGLSYAINEHPSKGDAVTVEFPADDPRTSRIEGLDATDVSPWLALVVFGIVPGFALSWFGIGLRDGVRRMRLLRHGVATRGLDAVHEPGDPARVLVLAEVPGGLRLDPQGALHVERPVRAIAAALFTLLAMAWAVGVIVTWWS